MSIFNDAVEQEIKEIVKNTMQTVNKEEINEIVAALMPQLEKIVEKIVTKYFRHMAGLIIYDGAFKEDS